MHVSKHSNEYIKIQSSLLDTLIQNTGAYSSISLKGNVNCCEDVFTNTLTLPLTGFRANLTSAVAAEASLFTISLKNLRNGQVFPISITNIDLGYVADNCTLATCTLQTYQSYFAPLFKTAIDSVFTSPTSVVTFVGNTIVVTGVPSTFVLNEIIYNATVVKFGLGDVTNDIFLGPDGLYVASSFFNNLVHIDGIYRFELKLFKSNPTSYSLETNCAFIDIKMKCQVAATLQNIKNEAEDKDLDKTSTILHLLHYSLVNGSNCGCNCAELCIVFKELHSMLNNLDPLITNNCGC